MQALASLIGRNPEEQPCTREQTLWGGTWGGRYMEGGSPLKASLGAADDYSRFDLVGGGGG